MWKRLKKPFNGKFFVDYLRKNAPQIHSNYFLKKFVFILFLLFINLILKVHLTKMNLLNGLTAIKNTIMTGAKARIK
jgi:hypothetical protein